MGAELINLRRARKAKERAEKEKTAEAKRVLHGTPKSLRKLSEAEKAKSEQNLAAHRLEKDRSAGEVRSGSVPTSDHQKDDK
ncbi:MAG TPA: DUF4169 family protein [Rhizomicrobium sp.]|jgi:hypothetical protein|nr:DUF4169 family protein [Rhizomicrobium sp.]